jgi:hypothetical protein
MVRSASKSANSYLVKEVTIGFEPTIRRGEQQPTVYSPRRKLLRITDGEVG